MSSLRRKAVNWVKGWIPSNSGASQTESHDRGHQKDRSKQKKKGKPIKSRDADVNHLTAGKVNQPNPENPGSRSKRLPNSGQGQLENQRNSVRISSEPVAAAAAPKTAVVEKVSHFNNIVNNYASSENIKNIRGSKISNLGISEEGCYSKEKSEPDLKPTDAPKRRKFAGVRSSVRRKNGKPLRNEGKNAAAMHQNIEGETNPVKSRQRIHSKPPAPNPSSVSNKIQKKSIQDEHRATREPDTRFGSTRTDPNTADRAKSSQLPRAQRNPRKMHQSCEGLLNQTGSSSTLNHNKYGVTERRQHRGEAADNQSSLPNRTGDPGYGDFMAGKTRSVGDIVLMFERMNSGEQPALAVFGDINIEDEPEPRVTPDLNISFSSDENNNSSYTLDGYEDDNSDCESFYSAVSKVTQMERIYSDLTDSDLTDNGLTDDDLTDDDRTDDEQGDIEMLKISVQNLKRENKSLTKKVTKLAKSLQSVSQKQTKSTKKVAIISKSQEDLLSQLVSTKEEFDDRLCDITADRISQVRE